MPYSNQRTAPRHGAVATRVGLWAVASLLALASMLYGVFWLPYREPGKEVPRIVKILPLEAGLGAASQEETEDRPYAWVDREAEVVRIPVEEAMTILAGRLPVREGAYEALPGNALRRIPTDAGSGRYVTPRGSDTSRR